MKEVRDRPGDPPHVEETTTEARQGTRGFNWQVLVASLALAAVVLAIILLVFL